MDYNEYVKIRIFEKRNSFIYGEKEERSAYLKSIAGCSFFENEKLRIPIYVDFNGFKDAENELCEERSLNSFQNSYFELYITSLMMDRLKKDLKEEELLKLENNLKKLLFDDSIKSFDILKKELEIGMNAYKELYEHYRKTGELKSNLFDDVKIQFIMLDFFLPNLKMVIPSLSDFILMFDKVTDFSSVYTKVINTYIASRSNSYLNIKVGCENAHDWKNYSTVSGEFVEYIHDYGIFELKDFSLKRQKKE